MKCISGERLAYLATTFAGTLAEDLSADDVNILGNFFSIVGDSLSLIASKRESNE
jgi:hypothetical protein